MRTTIATFVLLLVPILLVPTTRSAEGAPAPPGRGEIDELIRKIRAGDEQAATEAAYKLTQLGNAAVPRLGALLSDKREQVRAFAIGTLGAIGTPEVIPYLTKALLDTSLQGEEKVSRMVAARILGKVGRVALPAVPALVACLGDAARPVQWSAAEALSLLGPEGLAALERARKSPRAAVRTGAAIGLHMERAARGIAAMSELIAALKDPEVSVRSNSADALGRLGPEAAKAVAPLVEALGDRDWTVRQAAAKALGSIGRRAGAARETLTRRWNTDEDALVRAAAEAALEQITGAKPKKGSRPSVVEVTCPKGSKPRGLVLNDARLVIRQCLLGGNALAKAVLLDYREEHVFAVKLFAGGWVAACQRMLQPQAEAALAPVQKRALQGFIKDCP